MGGQVESNPGGGGGGGGGAMGCGNEHGNLAFLPHGGGGGGGRIVVVMRPEGEGRCKPFTAPPDLR